MRSHSPVDALFPEVRTLILATLLLSNKSWYLRDLAKHLGKTPSSLQRELASLSQAGILKQTRDGNRVYYQANESSAVFTDLRGLFTKTAGLVDVVRGGLSDLASQIRVAWIFGSFAKGEQRGNSDVDILLVGSLKLMALSKALRNIEARLGRAVNPVIYSETEFRDKLRRRNHFVRMVLEEPKLFLLGTEHDLAAIRNGRTGEKASNVKGGTRRTTGNRQTGPGRRGHRNAV